MMNIQYTQPGVLVVGGHGAQGGGQYQTKEL